MCGTFAVRTETRHNVLAALRWVYLCIRHDNAIRCQSACHTVGDLDFCWANSLSETNSWTL